MKVIKRSGKQEDVKFDQISDRLRMLSEDLSIDPIKVARTVCAQIKDQITTRQLDELSANICASLSIEEPEYDILGTRILMSSHAKDTAENYVDVVSQLQSNLDVLGQEAPILHHDFATFVLENADVVATHFQKCQDTYTMYQMSMFGWKTLYRSYLLQSNRKVVERAEHLFYRVALFLHYPNLEKTEETYRHLVQGDFIHATPTLFHAGTKRPQLSSCFLLGTEDNVDGIYKTITDVARISKWAGGIGVHISNIRAKNSYIRGTNGYSNGIMPMLRVFNDTSRYIDQCVHGDTLVFTKEGPKRICMLQPGKDAVLQKSGRFEVLRRKLEHAYDGEVYAMRFENGTTLQITPEHPVYGVHDEMGEMVLGHSDALLADSSSLMDTTMEGEGDGDGVQGEEEEEEECWIDVEDLRIGDRIAFPVPQHTVDDSVGHSELMMFCWGSMLGWGNMTMEGCAGSIRIPIDACQEIVQAFQYFFSSNLLHYQTYLHEDSMELRFRRTNVFPIQYSDLYDERGKRRIHPSILHLPLTKLAVFFRGWLYTHAKIVQEMGMDMCTATIRVDEYAVHTYESLLYVMTRLFVASQYILHDDGRHATIHVHMGDLERQGFVRKVKERNTRQFDMRMNVESEDHLFDSSLSLLQSFGRAHIKTKAQVEVDGHAPRIKSKTVRFGRTSPSPRFVHHRIFEIQRQHYQGMLYDLEFEKEHSYVVPSAVLHNGGGKRKGSFAMYIEPWHADIFDFVYAKRNVGNEDERARDLFYGLWIPDLFMKRVEENGTWSLMCPNVCPGLNMVYGDEFDALYTRYETEGRFVRQIPARELWKEILQSQIETGLPYMLYKDSCNRKSNQQNIGTIRSSNLCTEIIEVSDHQEYAVCNLASINLSNCTKPKVLFKEVAKKSLTVYTRDNCAYCHLLKARMRRAGLSFEEVDIVKDRATYDMFLEESKDTAGTVPRVVVGEGYGEIMGFQEFWETYLCPDFDFEELAHRVSVLVVNMNQIIDKNFYPTKETKASNLSHRPIGLGVQGLADLFCRLGYAFDSPEARHLNRKVFETMYFAALQTSMQYAKDNDKMYASFKGSPLSNGKFHFDLCPNFDPAITTDVAPFHDWEGLRKRVMKHGVSNSLFIAPMPTASTSQILYQNECFEPFTSNLYVRRTLAGEFTIFNKYLVQDLHDIGMWNQETIDHLIVHRGSIQKFAALPYSLRQVYRTAWEIPQKSLIDMAYQRQWFIDQSQSFNLFVADPTMDKLTKIHFYGWKNGLKTGSYYIRTKPQHFSQNFTIDPTKEEDKTCLTCSA